jgi:hypothetical protein
MECIIAVKYSVTEALFIKVSILLRAEIDDEKCGTNMGNEKLCLIFRLLRRLQIRVYERH